jgi:hypothetical protein
MIDFWNMMGLLVTDEEFRDSLFALPKTKYNIGSNQRASIPADMNKQDDYATIRSIVQLFMPNKPLSLMALGEMLVALSSEKFRDRAVIVADKIDAMDLDLPDDTDFLVVLGALVTDQGLVNYLIQKRQWKKWGFGFVSRHDRRLLARLLDKNVNETVWNAVFQFCNTLWDHECNDNVVEWPEHTHPVAL